MTLFESSYVNLMICCLLFKSSHLLCKSRIQVGELTSHLKEFFSCAHLFAESVADIFLKMEVKYNFFRC